MTGVSVQISPLQCDRQHVRLLDVKTAHMHGAGECMAVRERNGQVILTFMSEDEESGDWVDGEGQLASLISVRSELARGDLRALYLGWLLCAQTGDLDGDELEPPVPAGLAQLSASLDGLVEFLRIDPELVGVAAAMSRLLVNEQPKPEEVRKWLAKLSVTEKDDFLVRLISGDDHALSHQIVRSIGRERKRNRRIGNGVPRRRTVAELLRAAERTTIVRKQIAAERAAKEKARLERDAALARVKRLDQLAGRELMLWKKVEGLMATKQPRKYDEAVEVLEDLRDLAGSDVAEFRRRVGALRAATRTWVEDQVKKHGYGTVSEYIRQLLREEQKRQLREEVDRNLLDALDSGEATPLTPRDWQDIEREGLRRVRKRKNTRATR